MPPERPNSKSTDNNNNAQSPELLEQETETTSTKEAASLQGGLTGVTAPRTGFPNPFTSSKPKTTAPPTTPRKKNEQWSSSVQSLLDRPAANFPLKVILGGMVFCAAFGVWAWFGTIEEVGQAVGKLVPEGQTYKIQPSEGGKVSRVPVKEGQSVKAGDVLVELDTEVAQKEIERLKQSLSFYQSQVEQKKTLLEQVEKEAQTSAASASAEELAQRSAIALAREKAATTSQVIEQQRTEAAAYEARKKRLESLPSTAENLISQLREQEKAYEKKIATLEELQKQGAVSKERVEDERNKLRSVQQQITQTQLQQATSANEQLFEAEQAIQEVETSITKNLGELTTSNKEVEQLEAQLLQKQAEASKTQIAAQQKNKQLVIEVTQIQASIADTEKSISTARAKLKNSYLKAPVDGVVLSLNLKNTGEVLQSGQTAAEIAPAGAPLVLSAVVPDSKAGRIKTDMEVQVKFDAYPYQDYGIVSGEVTDISKDSKSDEKLGQVYSVEIELDKDYVTDDGQKIEFRAGQTATADIVIRRRRIIDVLLDPIRQIGQNGNKL
jgi:HlyD family secretion protein